MSQDNLEVKLDLKTEIYNIAKENIQTAKNLYASLTENIDGVNANLIIINSEQAVNCLKVIRENTDSLIKLYAESNKNDLQNKPTFKNDEIYDLLDSIANPYSTREKIN